MVEADTLPDFHVREASNMSTWSKLVLDSSLEPPCVMSHEPGSSLVPHYHIRSVNLGRLETRLELEGLKARFRLPFCFLEVTALNDAGKPWVWKHDPEICTKLIVFPKGKQLGSMFDSVLGDVWYWLYEHLPLQRHYLADNHFGWSVIVYGWLGQLCALSLWTPNPKQKAQNSWTHSKHGKKFVIKTSQQSITIDYVAVYQPKVQQRSHGFVGSYTLLWDKK